MYFEYDVYHIIKELSVLSGHPVFAIFINNTKLYNTVLKLLWIFSKYDHQIRNQWNGDNLTMLLKNIVMAKICSNITHMLQIALIISDIFEYSVNV